MPYRKSKLDFSFARRVLILIISLIEFILGLRIFLQLLSANPNTPFVKAVYFSSQFLVDPFTGIFTYKLFDAIPGLEMSTIVAFIVYPLLAFVTLQLLEMMMNEK
jgi:hypothetical protein